MTTSMDELNLENRPSQVLLPGENVLEEKEGKEERKEDGVKPVDSVVDPLRSE